MIHLVTGGSGSGKSEYAENWLTGRNKKDGTYIYIATMQPYTEETMKKIERHHRLRAGKGFRTLEKYTDLSELEIPKNQGILLECISNLVANELYREDGTLNDLKETKEKVLAGVRRLSNSTTRLVIVTNEVNADINGYSEETEKYRECIGMVNQSLAELADIVTEVVYGIPVCIRKEQKKYEEYKRIWNSFKIAFSMYSRIPMPRSEWTDENKSYAMCFFPWIGAVIGLCLMECFGFQNGLMGMEEEIIPYFL